MGTRMAPPTILAGFWRAPSIASSEDKNVIRHTDDLAPANDLAFRFENLTVQPARSVDLRSRGEIRLKLCAILDHNVMSGLPEYERRRFAALFGNRLPGVVGGSTGERHRHRACGLVTHAGVGSEVAEQVDPIDHESHHPESIRQHGMRQPPASDLGLPPPTRTGVPGKDGCRWPPRSPRAMLAARPCQLPVEMPVIPGLLWRGSNRLRRRAFTSGCRLGLAVRDLLPGPVQHVVAHHLRVLRRPVDLSRVIPQRLDPRAHISDGSWPSRSRSPVIIELISARSSSRA